MKSAIRCCISCILPCGALDVIRIVHVNGRVEEITGTIYAAEILKAHPRHILKKPSTKPISDDYIETTSAHHQPAIVVVPPDAQLQRGKIYFLIPVSHKSKSNNETASCKTKMKRTRKDDQEKKVGRGSSSSSGNNHRHNNNENNNNEGIMLINKDDDNYLSEIMSENKVSSQRERRRGRVGVWRPHLESITELFSDCSSID